MQFVQLILQQPDDLIELDDQMYTSISLRYQISMISASLISTEVIIFR